MLFGVWLAPFGLALAFLFYLALVVPTSREQTRSVAFVTFLVFLALAWALMGRGRGVPAEYQPIVRGVRRMLTGALLVLVGTAFGFVISIGGDQFLWLSVEAQVAALLIVLCILVGFFVTMSGHAILVPSVLPEPESEPHAPAR